jgi:ring-1,2-phenylacetyl-CoA epoxidase subunit PaaE
MTQAKPSEWIVDSCLKEAPDAVRIKLRRKHNVGHVPITAHPGASIGFLLPTTPRLKRRYSLISAIDSDAPEFIVKEVKGGVASQFFHEQMKTGDTLEMRNVQNNLWKEHWSGEPKSFICFAAGIGISPVYSLLRWGLQDQGNPAHSFRVFYGSRTPRHALLAKELDELKSNDRFELHRLFSERSNSEEDTLGRITKPQIRKWLTDNPEAKDAEYVISGPFGMMQNVHDVLDELNIPASQRHTEYFTDRIIQSQQNVLVSPDQNAESRCSQARPKCTVEIEQDSGIQTFTMHGDGKSILRAALEAGLDVPHSCRGGICLSCQAQVIDGEILRDGVSGLSESEKSDGKILCCRTQPKTSQLKLRFDR